MYKNYLKTNIFKHFSFLMIITACIDLPLHCVCVHGLVKNDIKGSDLYILI